MAPPLILGLRAASPPLGDAPRVLVVRTGAIGDVVNALVFAGALRAARPAAHIGWVAHPLVTPLLEKNPAVDRVHHWPRGAGARGLWRLVRELRHERYDIAIDLQRLQKSALVARASGARRVLGFDRARTKELSHVWTRERLAPADPRAHMVEQYLCFARHLGLEPGPPTWPLPPLAEARAAAAGLLAPLAGAPYRVFNLGASKPAKRWPGASFAALAELSPRDHPALVLTGGPGDRAAADEVLRGTQRVALDLAGRTELLTLAAVLEGARDVVTGDTAAMHLAVAFGVPTLALFGPGDARRTGPYRHEEWVLRAPPWDGERRPESRAADLHPEDVAAVLGAAPWTPDGDSSHRAPVLA